jgi:glucosamine--fructose-6-phosphate aminotransferase (isomerizing)
MTHEPGTLMAAEIAEQPQVWRRIAEDGRGAIDEVARRVAQRAPRFVLFVARGSSDHAALYGKYLAEIELGLPAGLMSPSTMTVYESRPDFRDVLVIAVSQSGGSPDLVHTVQVAREQGALTVALTNDAESALAAEAELHLDILAGPEESVAATKSYTAQLLVLHLLIARLRGRPVDAVEKLPRLGEQVLERLEPVVDTAQRYRFAARMVTTGRGYAYPSAREAALKLMETSYLSAQAFSGADLLHGPLAMVDPQVPVLALVPHGKAGAAMAEVLPRLAERGADVLGIGSAEAIASCTTGLAMPTDVAEPLSPLLEILPVQRLALHLAVARGGDPDTPRGLSKVTETL